MIRKIKFGIGVLFFIGIIILSIYLYSIPPAEYTVTFIDVGQGDSAVVSGSGANVLIDAGPYKDARNVKITLDRLNIKELDLVVVSHLDSDHISGMRDIINNYKVKKIITGETSKRYLPNSSSFSEFMTAVDIKNIPLTMVRAGDKLKVKSVDINVISPSKEYGDSNEDSAVLQLKCGQKKLLFTGDISAKVEENILDKVDLKSDILKIAHHGSYYSSSEEFLNKVKPSFAVASLSMYNNFNHPNVEVFNRLRDMDCEVFRTDESGNVTFFINGGDIRCEVEK